MLTGSPSVSALHFGIVVIPTLTSNKPRPGNSIRKVSKWKTALTCNLFHISDTFTRPTLFSPQIPPINFILLLSIYPYTAFSAFIPEGDLSFMCMSGFNLFTSSFQHIWRTFKRCKAGGTRKNVEKGNEALVDKTT